MSSQVRLDIFQGKQTKEYNFVVNEIWAKIFTENNINSSLHAVRNVVKEITEYKLENIKTEQKKNQQF